jgi:hypothetical protein
MKIIDIALVNLRIISRIPEKCKLLRIHKVTGVLRFDTVKSGIVQGFFRYIRGDSRDHTVNDVSDIIENSILLSNEIIESSLFQRNNKKIPLNLEDSFVDNKLSREFALTNDNLTLLIKSLLTSVNGLNSLKKTYNKDPVITAKLDMLILKINSHCSLTSKKFLRNLDNSEESESILHLATTI